MNVAQEVDEAESSVAQLQDPLAGGEPGLEPSMSAGRVFEEAGGDLLVELTRDEPRDDLFLGVSADLEGQLGPEPERAEGDGLLEERLDLDGGEGARSSAEGDPPPQWCEAGEDLGAKLSPDAFEQQRNTRRREGLEL